MLFILVIAAVLYIYRLFRKTGVNAPSKYVESTSTRVVSLPLVKKSTIYETLQGRSIDYDYGLVFGFCSFLIFLFKLSFGSKRMITQYH